MRTSIAAVFLSLSVITRSTAAQPVPVFTGLGVPGATGGFSHARAISPDGSGVYGVTSDGVTSDGFRWTPVGGLTPLGLGDLGVNGGVWAASVDGRTVVGRRQLGGQPSVAFATVGGVAVPLPALAGYADAQTQAQGVSGDGTVIVGMQNGTMLNGSGRLQAVRWAGGVAAAIAPVGTGEFDFSIAYGVSRDGSVVVGGLRPTGSTDRAFRWTQATGAQTLPLAPGFTFSTATAVSADNGTVIGAVLRDTAGGVSPDEYEAVRFVGGGVELLGDLPGGPLFSIASAVSADGSVIVGRSAVGGTAPRGDDRAFIWDAGHGMRDLAAVLMDLGADLTGWTLKSAWAVSDDGRTIAGDATDPDGRDVAFVAVVPEPAVLGVAAAWVVTVGAMRRGRRDRRG